jgi:spermidine synthase
VADTKGERRILALLALLFFLSGASALVYQSLWLRLLGLIFGVTIYAASTVWATFMAGLAVGNVIAGRFADRARRPMLWFGVAEVAVGLTALTTPWLLDALQSAYRNIYDLIPHSLFVVTAIRLTISFVVLIVPTALMGMTLPLVIRSSTSRIATIGKNVSVLYGANTAGAIAGTLAAGFYLIPHLGVHLTFVAAAAINIAVGLAAIALERSHILSEDRQTISMNEGAAEPVGPHITPVQRSLVLVAFAVSGFVSLALEVIWFRALSLFMQPTVYSFSVMLATVLAGIAFGSWAIGPRIDRPAPWVGILGMLEVAIGVAAVLSFQPLVRLLDVERVVRPFLPPVIPAYAVYPVAASALAILPTTIVMGLAFPIGLRLWAVGAQSAGANVGRRVGAFYAVNLTASIAGSLLAGFALLPLFGSRNSLIATSALSLGVGFLLLLRSELSMRLRWAACAIGLLAFGFGAAYSPQAFEEFAIQRYPGQHVTWYEEGIQSTVLVHEESGGKRILTVNGAHQADTDFRTVRAHRIIGTLPMALHPDPHDALVIGLGGGATAGAVSRYPQVHVDVVELSGAVVRGARLFDEANDHLLERPNVTLRVDDGRNFLMLTASRYDVVTGDIIQPITAGSASLYSIEYFDLIRRALRPGAVVMQWVSDASDAEYRLIARTFLTAFPNATAWNGGTLLIGTVGPLKVHRQDFERKLQSPDFSAELRDVGMATFDDLLQLFAAGPDALRQFLGDGEILTDDRPLTEYFLNLPDRRPADLAPLQKAGADVREIVDEQR